MPTSVRPLAVLTALFLAAATAAAADETYAVKIERPTKAGDAYDTRIVVESRRSTDILIPGSPPRSQDEAITGEITGRVDVAQVDARGVEQNLTLTITKFTVGPQQKEALSPGKIIKVARTTTGVDFSLDGGAIDPDAQQVLAQVYTKLNVSPLNDDDVFGTKTPQKAGDSWPINADLAAKQAAGADIQVDPKNISGQTTLNALETAAGKPALRLVTTMTFTDMAGKLPAGAAVDSSVVKGEIRTLVPTDTAQPVLERENTIDTAIVLKMTGANPAQITVKGRQHLLQTFTPIKK